MGFFAFANAAFAQDEDANENDNEDLENYDEDYGESYDNGFADEDINLSDYEGWWAYDSSLIPCSHLYGHSWDSLNVDQPKLAGMDSLIGITLGLVESGCDYHHPCPGDLTSNFGWRYHRMHKGVDIDLETGDPVYAAFDGVVRIAKYNAGGYGNYVVIRHYNGLETLYGHLSERWVIPNQTVSAGQIIGLGGNTGRSTGSHLHFETLYKGRQLDPNKIISFTDKQLKVDSVYISISDFNYPTKPATTTSTSTTSSTKTKSSKVYHKVKKGETLWAISRKYGTTVSKICKLNGIKESTPLQINQNLRVK